MDYHKFQQQLPNLFNNWRESSCHPKSEVFKDISTQLNSIISPNVMQLLNFAVSCLEENEIYCEIGTYPGASLISALVNNPDKIAYAVDNFSELDTEDEDFDKLSNNLETFNIADQVFFCYQDAEEFFLELKKQELTEKIGIYFYDANQNYRDYLLGLLNLQPLISHQAIIIITNCQWTSCQQAVRDFLAITPQAKLILDFTQSDYLLWNGIQVLSWDTQQSLSNYSENNKNIDLLFQESINNITQLEKRQTCNLLEAKALSLLQEKKYSEAEKTYFTVLAVSRNNSSVWQNLGTLYYEQGEYLKALDCLNKALIIDDNQAVYHYTIGLILEKSNINQAIVAYKRAIELNPQLVDAYNNLGNLYLALNEVEEAQTTFQEAINTNPYHFGAYFNLGNLFFQKYQNIDDAIFYYEKSSELNPNNIEISDNLSLVKKIKSDEVALLLYQISHYSNPDQYEEVVKICKQAISKNIYPQKVYEHLFRYLNPLGRSQQAVEEAKSALQLFPNDLEIQIASLNVLPPIYRNTEEIEFYRDYFQQQLDSLLDKLLKTNINQDTLVAISWETIFYLAYQGKNDIELQKKYGEILHQIMRANYPQWCQDLPYLTIQKGEKIRVGYISTHLHKHSGTHWCLGAVKNHNRQDFQIYCYHIGTNVDEATEQYDSYSYRFVHIPNDIEAVCNQVIADKLHILVIPAIGMIPLNGLIAALRLAPIQCTTWGHPVTSGIPTVDYFLSSELMESENAQEHYSEALIRLPNLGLCYPQPLVPEVQKTRSYFGIPEDCTLYLSCQSTCKYLPQYDYLFVEIAQQVNNAKFVFAPALEGKHITNIFRQRLQKVFAQSGLNSEDYCIILPRQIYDDFLCLNLISDVFLDTFGWSGGWTTLDAIACNLPIVTCPGELMRGRQSYGFLKMIGVTDTIANSEAEYIEIAVRLALDIDWRNSIIERTKKNQHRVFNDKTSVEGLEAFYKQVVQEKSSGS